MDGGEDSTSDNQEVLSQSDNLLSSEVQHTTCLAATRILQIFDYSSEKNSALLTGFTMRISKEKSNPMF